MVVPHPAVISVLAKAMQIVQIVLKGNRFLGEGFPQGQGREIICENAEVFPELSEMALSNSSLLFVKWGTVGSGEALLLFSLLNNSKGPVISRMLSCQSLGLYFHLTLFTFNIAKEKQR